MTNPVSSLLLGVEDVCSRLSAAQYMGLTNGTLAGLHSVSFMSSKLHLLASSLPSIIPPVHIIQ